MQNQIAKTVRSLGFLGLFLSASFLSSCGTDGDTGIGAVSTSSSSFRPTSCAISRNSFGHPQSCQCPSSSKYDEQHGVCSPDSLR